MAKYPKPIEEKSVALFQGGKWFVLYPDQKPVLCHNRSTAEFLAADFNKKVKLHSDNQER